MAAGPRVHNLGGTRGSVNCCEPLLYHQDVACLGVLPLSLPNLLGRAFCCGVENLHPIPKGESRDLLTMGFGAGFKPKFSPQEAGRGTLDG